MARVFILAKGHLLERQEHNVVEVNVYKRVGPTLANYLGHHRRREVKYGLRRLREDRDVTRSLYHHEKAGDLSVPRFL